MFTKLLTLSALLVSVSCLSVGTVSEQNVTKREANTGDLFPDWVPFKNKHGDELGEFVQVEKKNKVKKRLAPPMNFLLRAVAEPEGDDYFDKSGGESDGEEYYEKKDWSDIHRLADAVDKKVEAINHTEISDIDGVVTILTKKTADPILEAINDARNFQTKQKEKIERSRNINKEMSETTDATTEAPATTIEDKTEKNYINNEEENVSGDDDENSSPKKVKQPNSEEAKENEARKAKILSSVDELKQRHAEEQKELSEKIKEENLYENEFNIHSTYNKTPDKFLQDSSEEKERLERRQRKRGRRPTTKPDYDEYEDLNNSEDKYKIYKTEKVPPSTEAPKRNISKDGRQKNKYFGSAKASVFKNPRLFMMYDDSEETTIEPIKLTTIISTTNRGPQKFSSRYIATLPTDNDDRISLVPVNSKEGEPTLFFPTSRKNRRRRIRTTTLAPVTDSSVAETVTDSYKGTTGFDITASASLHNSTKPGSTSEVSSSEVTSAGPTKSGSHRFSTKPDSTSDVTSSEVSSASATESGSLHFSTKPDSTSDVTSSEVTSPGATATGSLLYSTNPDSASDVTSSEVTSAGTTGTEYTVTGPDTISTNSDTVTDAIPSSSDHEKEKSQDYHKEKGGGHEHHSEHSEEHEEHGKKAYEGHHEDTKAAKGYHDKDNHLGKYDDHGGVDKHHSEESGHYGDHHHEEHGKKHAKYEESGKHSKGHSTKGSHDIHKKEEYEKKVEFFEEDGDSGEEEKHGGYNHEKEHSEGGKFKGGNLKAGHEHHSKGEAGHFNNGGHHEVNKGHKQASGHDSHGKHGQKHVQKEANLRGKKWIYHQGYPAKTANLVVIDRRGDQFYHGPHYYG